MLGNAVAVERALSVVERVVELVGSVVVQGVEQVAAVEPVLIVVELVEFVVVPGVEPVFGFPGGEPPRSDQFSRGGSSDGIAYSQRYGGI